MLQKKKKQLYKIIFIISFIDFTCQLGFYFSCYANKGQPVFHNIDYLYSFLVIDIVSKYIFSRLILKTTFYFHHIVSIVLNIIVLLLLFFIEKDKKMGDYNNAFLILSIVQYILYSLEDILNKVALNFNIPSNNLIILPESILFYKGVFTFVYFICFTILLFLFQDLSIEDMTHNDFITILEKICVRFSFIIFNIIRSIYLVHVIYSYSSQHMSFLKVLESIILSIYYYFDRLYKERHKDYNNNYFESDSTFDLVDINICLFLLIITLIHNEIIIINCKKMREKTQYFLRKESEKEDKDLFQSLIL